MPSVPSMFMGKLRDRFFGLCYTVNMVANLSATLGSSALILLLWISFQQRLIRSSSLSYMSFTDIIKESPPPIVCILWIVGLFSHYYMWLRFQTTIYVLIIYNILPCYLCQAFLEKEVSAPLWDWPGSIKEHLKDHISVSMCLWDTQLVSCWLFLRCLLVQEARRTEHCSSWVMARYLEWAKAQVVFMAL